MLYNKTNGSRPSDFFYPLPSEICKDLYFFFNSAVIGEGKLRQRAGVYTWAKRALVSAEISVLLGWLHRKSELSRS